MAVLRTQDQERELPLPARCVIGRSRACDLELADPNISSQHASLEWNGTDWELRDLDSRNGTHVDDKRLASGTRRALAPGMRLRFGRTAADWTVVDIAPPQLMARNLTTGAHQFGEGGYLALPGANDPECTVYRDLNGVWIAERRGEPAAIDDRDVVTTAGDVQWRVHLPTSAAGTVQDSDSLRLLEGLRLCFSFTRDEEHVEAVAWSGGQRIDLQARAHHYPLLVLARRRLADQAAGVAEPEQGWVYPDELTKMLRMDMNHLNICIHRARAQLGQLAIADAARLVQRRSSTRQIRIGVTQLELACLD